MIINAANIRSMEAGFHTAFNKGYESHTPKYPLVATEIQSNTSEENYAWMGQLPQMHEWVGERVLQNISGYSYTIKNKSYEVTVSVDRDEIEDDRFHVYTPQMANLGAESSYALDNTVFDLMLGGFKNLCYDGKPFFSDKHELGRTADGKKNVVSNLSTKKLSQDSFMEGRTAMMSYVGDRGKTLRVIPDLLVVPPQLEHKAKLILEADMVGGTSNITKGMAKLEVMPELSAMPDAWFLLCTSKFLKPFILQMRKKPKFVALDRETDTNVFMRRKYLYGVDGRWNGGYALPQLAYGSTGETA